MKIQTKKMNEKNGITLVSLVVTIVVLLILAGITVNVISGDNGLIKLSKEKTANMNEKFVNEEVKQLVSEYDVANNGETLEEFLKTKVPTRLDEVTRINDDQIEVKKSGYTVIIEDKYLTITLDLTPYEGIYDGQEHNTLTSVTVNPSDAKLEYSTDGINFSTTMPKIENASSVSVTVRATKKKYKDAIETRTAKVSKAEGKLVLSATSGTITYPISESFTVSENTGNLTVVSNNENIATASINQNIVAVKPGTTAGKAILTVTSAANVNYTEKTAAYTATVENGTITLSAIPYTGTYDGNAHNAFTNVTVTPSDAILEYSTDGTTYSTTMPTITNTSSFTVTVKASKEGYKTETITETVKVNKANGSLTLSSYSGTLTYPNSGTFTVSENTGNLSVSSSNTNVATASLSENTVTVKSGTTAGKATITVTSAASTNYTEKTATYTATVENGTITLSATPYTGTYDGNAHNAFTNVTVTPSDAVLEYSTNDTTYSTTMPTITNASSFTVTVKASKAGYKTQTITETVKVNKASGSLRLSSYSGTLTYPDNGTFTVSGNTGSLSVSSSNTSIATVSLSGNTVTMKPGRTEGSTTITVTSAASANYTAKSVTYNVTVKLQTFTGSSGVGYYADVDGDGTVDGIIYADRLVGASGSWGTGVYDYSYSISKVSSTKGYYVSQTNYKGPFGTKNVLSPTGSGNARFYVMTLNDYNGSLYTFSNSQNISVTGWSVPSPGLWAAFAGQLKITSSNYSGYGLRKEYWTSSANHNEYCFSDGIYITFYPEGVTAINNIGTAGVRLTRTF